ncbi:MAG: hypothetical protein H7123_06370, partial [Thermoleophilia bacterium]|nr:hypothetical protein [Thermoleophilia bacterium]
PLGASIGDYFSQPRTVPHDLIASGELGTADVGLALGTTGTSAIFLLTILGVVIYLTITRRDRTDLVGAEIAKTGDHVHVEPHVTPCVSCGKLACACT